MSTSTLKYVQLAVLFLICWQHATAQLVSSADAVFNNYLNAIGGKAFIMNIRDVQIETSLALSVETDTAEGKVCHIYKLPIKSLVAFYDRIEEISRHTSDGIRIKTKSACKLYDDRNYEGSLASGYILSSALFPELYYKELGLTVTFNGTEKVSLNGIGNGHAKDVYKITFSTKDGSIFWSTYYDTDTFLKVQMSGPRRILEYGIEAGQRGADYIYYVNYLKYKNFYGLNYPTMIKEYGRTTLVRKVELNKNPDDSVFTVD